MYKRYGEALALQGDVLFCSMADKDEVVKVRVEDKHQRCALYCYRVVIAYTEKDGEFVSIKACSPEVIEAVARQHDRWVD